MIGRINAGTLFARINAGTLTPFLALIVLSLVCIPSFSYGANDVTLTAVVSNQRAMVSDTISYTVTVAGELSEVTHPLLALPDSFRQIQSNPQISQRVSIVNGKYSRNVDFVYQLSCLKPGKFVIPPASLRADNKDYKSNVIAITVLAAGSSAAATHNASGRGGVKLVAQVQPEEAYVGQAVSILISLYVPRSLLHNGRWGWMEKPSAKGFLPEAIDGAPPEWQLTTVDGIPTMVCILGRYVVTPTTTGRYKFNPGIAVVLLKDNSKQRTSRRRSLFDSFFEDDFFGRNRSKKVNVAGIPVSFDVKALPLKVADRSLLCVSDMMAFSKVSKNRLNENESLTYTLKFEGNGDLRSVEAPVLQTKDNFRVFESSSNSNIIFGPTGIRSAKVFEYVLVPTRSGNLQLPEVKLRSFDPDNKRVVTTIAPAVNLEIIPGEKEEDIQMVTSHISKRAVKLTGRDINYIAQSREGAVFLSAKPFHRQKLFWVLLILPFVLVTLDFYFTNRGELTSQQKQSLRASQALKTARRSIVALKAYKDEPKKYYSLIRSLMMKYIADKLGLSSSGIVFSEVQNDIEAIGVPSEDLKVFESYLDDFSGAAFSPVSFSSAEMEGQAKEVSTLLSNIDRRWS